MQENRHLLLAEREKTHGSFTMVAKVAQDIKDAIHWGNTKGKLPHYKEALDSIAVKLARISCGDHENPEHWLDIQGYAELALELIRKEKPSEPKNEVRAVPRR